MAEGSVVSVHVGSSGTLDKAANRSIEMAIDGIVGDRHRGSTRKAWASGDKQPGGTVRRNERQWSAIAQEDLLQIAETMNLSEPLTATTVAVNLCIAGIDDFSRLPRGTTLAFSSGVVLMVEEYNLPCGDQSLHVAEQCLTKPARRRRPRRFPMRQNFVVAWWVLWKCPA